MPAPGLDGATVSGFDECLRHNEMELALDELEDLGLTNAPPPGVLAAPHLRGREHGTFGTCRRFQAANRKRMRPNLAVNTDAPSAAASRPRGSPVTLVR